MRKSFTPWWVAVFILLFSVSFSVGAVGYKVAYITGSGKAGAGVGATTADSLDTQIYPYFAANHTVTLFNAGLYTTAITADSVKTLFNDYDLVVCSETVGGTNKLGIMLKNLIGYKPFLNFKAFFYTVSGRWGWAAPVDGAVSTGVPVEYQSLINRGYTSHPIFTGTTLRVDTIQDMASDLVLRSTKYKGHQGFTTTSLVSGIGGSFIATPVGTPSATSIHEINTNPKAKYLLMSVCSDNYDKVNAEGLKMVENAVNYLMDSLAVFYAAPVIKTLTIGSKTATIANNTISADIVSKDTNFVTAFTVDPAASLFIINNDTIATGETVNYANYIGTSNPSTIVLRNGTESATYSLVVQNGELKLNSLSIGGKALTINTLDSTIVDTLKAGSYKLKTDFSVAFATSKLVINNDTIETGETVDYTALSGVETDLMVKNGAFSTRYKLALTVQDPLPALKPTLTAGAMTDTSVVFSWAALNGANKYSLAYGQDGVFTDTLNTTALTSTVTKLTPSKSYSFKLYASSDMGHTSLTSDTIVKTTENKYLFYTDFLTIPAAFPATGNLYNQVFTRDSSFTYGTGNQKLTIYVPTLAGTQRLHFNNAQAAKTDTTLDYGAATTKDLGATTGTAQVLTTVGAYFLTPKVAGPASVAVWVADGGPGSAKTTISKKVNDAASFTGDVIYTNGGSNKKIYKYVYESQTTDSVQFKILPGNLKVYTYNIKVQAMPLSTASTMTSFSFGLAGEADTILAPTGTEHGKINIGLASGTTVTALTPTISVSAGATVNPASGVTADFTTARQYTVTAQDAVTQSIYDVNVSVAKTLSKACEITQISVNGKVGVIDTTSINVKLIKSTGSLGKFPVTYTLSDLAKTTISSGDSIDFSSGTATLKVTAQDGVTFKNYTINVSLANKYVVAYMTASGKAGATSGATTADTLDTGIYPTLASKYDVQLINSGTYTADMTEAQIKALFADYDLAFLSETVSGTNKLALGSKYLVGYKPFLNSKAFVYTSGRWSYATPVNGDGQTGTAVEYKAVINAGYKNHPIFTGTTITADTLVQPLSADLTIRSSWQKGLQGFTTSTIGATIGGEMIARPIGTSTATCFHEINTVPTAKYLLMAFCSDNYDKLTEDGMAMISNACDYLLGSTVYVKQISGLHKTTDGLEYYTTSHSLELHGLSNGSLIEVYNLSGVKLQSIQPTSSSVSVAVKGVNIVRISSAKGVNIIKAIGE
jgi:hypothetical protein